MTMPEPLRIAAYFRERSHCLWLSPQERFMVAEDRWVRVDGREYHCRWTLERPLRLMDGPALMKHGEVARYGLPFFSRSKDGAG